MDLRLEGKVALATGASRSIGRGIAAAFVGAGAKVMVASRSAETYEKASGAIGTHCRWVAFNALGSWVTGQTIAVDGRELVAFRSEPTV
jgi:NADP-dependent 3-hydroxy acid dehydrogenase YdfG